MSGVAEFLQQYGGPMLPIVAFEQIGATIAGTILYTPIRDEQTVDGGGVQPVLKISVEAGQGTNITAGKAGERRAVQQGEHVSIWIKPGAQTAALFEACARAGVLEPERGGQLAMRYTADGQRSPGKSPPKQYQCRYEAPVHTNSVDDLLDGSQSTTAGDPPLQTSTTTALDELF